MNPLTLLSAKNPMLFRHCAGLIATLLLSSLTGMAGVAENTAHYRQDLIFLGSKLSENRDRLKAAADGGQHLAALDEQLKKLQSTVDTFATLATELDTQDSRLAYLKEAEIAPKAREIERARQNLEQRYADAARIRQAYEQDVQAHNSRPPPLGFDASAYNQEKLSLDTRASMLRSSIEISIADAGRTIDTAMRNYTFSQQQFTDLQTQREQTARKLQEIADFYARNRETVAAQLSSVEKNPPANTTPVQSPSASAGVNQEKPVVPPGNETPRHENDVKK